MRTRRWFGIYLLAGAMIALGLPAGLAIAQDVHPEGSHSPPSEGKVVRGHWTPYEPPDPAAFPEDSRIHIIVVDDTLWDLAANYLGDPWLWPQIWDQNRYVLDSHWIYPGDPLLIPPVPTVVSDGSEVPETAGAPEEPFGTEGPVATGEPGMVEGGETTEFAESAAPVEPVTPTEDRPLTPAVVSPILEPGSQAYPQALRAGPGLIGPELRPVGDETDLYCSSYLVPQPPAATLQIASAEEADKMLLSDYDIVYLNQGIAEGVQPGAEYMILRTGDAIRHPVTNKQVGHLMSQVGRLRVLVVQEHTATAWIESGCSEVELGDALVPFEEVPVPLSAGMPMDRYEVDLSGQRGHIVFGHLGALAFGAGDLVELDIGSGEGVEPGDFMAIFRDYVQPGKFFSTELNMETSPKQESWAAKSPYPPKVLGQVVILRVQEHTATAKIVRSFRTINVGDKVTKL